MGRNLVVCCDGTWNNPQQEDNGVPAATNVVRLYHALSAEHQGVAQLRYYHPGLGGEDSGIKDAILGGALGVGICRHICSAYHWLAQQYQPGDHILLFGFSRGAFTVRSLAGMLAYGLLELPDDDSRSWALVEQLYQQGYRAGNANWAQGKNLAWHHDGEPAPVAFLGVWDTVGALGIPDDMALLDLFDSSEHWGFHDQSLGSNVSVARHAMALDERRSSFTVCRWDNLAARGGNVQECWFPGVHADVGGGYSECDLSNRALAWMLEQAEPYLGLRPNWRELLPADAGGVMHNSCKGLFARLRTRPRNIPLIDADSELPAWEAIDYSVFQRQQRSPLALPPYYPHQSLAVNARCEAEVFADTRWNDTRLYLPAGRYCFAAKGQWQDGRDSCDWRGTEDGKRTLGDIARLTGAFWGKFESLLRRITGNDKADLYGTRRHGDIPWFRMVGVITNDMGLQSGPVVGNDGSPRPHQYVDLTLHDADNPLELQHGGYLYAYANDAWSMYDNNHGAITLRVTRLA